MQIQAYHHVYIIRFILFFKIYVIKFFTNYNIYFKLSDVMIIIIDQKNIYVLNRKKTKYFSERIIKIRKKKIFDNLYKLRLNYESFSYLF